MYHKQYTKQDDSGAAFSRNLKQCKSRILYPVKLNFIYQGDRKTVLHMSKILYTGVLAEELSRGHEPHPTMVEWESAGGTDGERPAYLIIERDEDLDRVMAE